MLETLFFENQFSSLSPLTETTMGCAPALFDLIREASSLQVVQCFMGLLVFTFIMDVILDYVERNVIGSIVSEVLAKLYKELMLLGFISFGIFISLGSIKEVDKATLASFEYAHFVMFFLGGGIVAQTLWSIACNSRLQRDIWIACALDTSKALAAYHDKKQSLRRASVDKITTLFRKIRLTFAFEYATVYLHIVR